MVEHFGKNFFCSLLSRAVISRGAGRVKNIFPPLATGAVNRPCRSIFLNIGNKSIFPDLFRFSGFAGWRQKV